MAKAEIAHLQEKRKAIPPSNELPGFLALFFIEMAMFIAVYASLPVSEKRNTAMPSARITLPATIPVILRPRFSLFILNHSQTFYLYDISVHDKTKKIRNEFRIDHGAREQN